MAVRVRVKIGRRSAAKISKAVEVTAVANSGFEAEEPEILLPLKVAEKLGPWPPPKEARCLAASA